jgi:cytochrome c oxidase cbb3-type subunit 2
VKKIIILIAVIVSVSMAAYSLAQMGHGMMRGGQMKGGGMTESMQQMMQWMGGQEVFVDLSGPRPTEDKRTIEAGRRIYEKRCAVCHGEKGDGNGKRANDLYSKPRDFTNGIYKFRSTPTGSLPSDEDIYTTISRGIRGTAMLPWFGLNKEEKWAAVYYIKTFSERFEEEESDSPIVIPEGTDLGADSITRGKKLFEEAKCQECHGMKGRGDGPKSDELKDDWGHPIRPRSFTYESFKRGSKVRDIFLSVATGLNGTPMASYSDAMSDKHILEVAAYVNSIAWKRSSKQGGMMGMMSMTPDERAGMMIDHPGMSGGMMGDGMMGPGMMR